MEEVQELFNCYKIEDVRVHTDIMKHEMVEVFTELKNEAV